MCCSVTFLLSLLKKSFVYWFAESAGWFLDAKPKKSQTQDTHRASNTTSFWMACQKSSPTAEKISCQNIGMLSKREQ